MQTLLRVFIFGCIGLAILAAILNVVSGGKAINTNLPITETPAQPTGSAPTRTPRSTRTPAPTAIPIGYLSRAMVGDKWPLIVEDGIVRCSRFPGSVQAITFETGGKTYAINGSARARIEQFGWAPIEEIQKRETDKLGLLKYPITPLLDAGLALCK